MKKRYILFIIFVLIILYPMIVNYTKTDAYYMGKFGIKDWSNIEIKRLMNEFPYSQTNSNITIYCDGYDLIAKQGNKEYYFFRIEVHDNKYKFGLENLTIGTPRLQVEKVVNKMKKIKDLKEDACGYIVNDLWVQFIFNDQDVVEKILLYYGP